LIAERLFERRGLICMRVIKKDNACGVGDLIKYFRSTKDQNNPNLMVKGRKELSFAPNKSTDDGEDRLVSPFLPYQWFQTFILKLTNLAMTEDKSDRVAADMTRALEKLKDEHVTILVAALQTYVRSEKSVPEAISKWYDKYPVMKAMQEETRWFDIFLEEICTSLKKQITLSFLCI